VTGTSSRPKIGKRKKPSTRDSSDKWFLRLYVAESIPKSAAAFKNLKVVCEDQLKGKYHIDVIDLLKNPMLARDDQILAIPTLIRTFPLPVRTIIGDLSNTERLLAGLDLAGRQTTPRNENTLTVKAPGKRV
jgi:circadian clock protein KaiB